MKRVAVYDAVTRRDDDIQGARLARRIVRYRRALRRCARRLRRERAAREAADNSNARWQQAALIFARRSRP